jgi:hypothetical protein
MPSNISFKRRGSGVLASVRITPHSTNEMMPLGARDTTP